MVGQVGERVGDHDVSGILENDVSEGVLRGGDCTERGLAFARNGLRETAQLRNFPRSATSQETVSQKL